MYCMHFQSFFVPEYAFAAGALHWTLLWGKGVCQ